MAMHIFLLGKNERSAVLFGQLSCSVVIFPVFFSDNYQKQSTLVLVENYIYFVKVSFS